MHRHAPHQLMITAATVAATLALAACGGDDATTSTPSPAPASAGSGKTVGVQRVDGVGSVLVDSSGKALYTPDEEADGKVRCTGACASEWQPLTSASDSPSADATAGKLDVIERPDGTRQVTAGGKPLYTFVEDSPGEVTGDGFSDDFEGQHFTWHAVLAGGGSSSGSSGGSPGGY